MQGTDLDGKPTGGIELVQKADGRLCGAHEPVLAIRVIGSRVGLVIAGGQVCVTVTDYWRVMRHTDTTDDI